MGLVVGLAPVAPGVAAAEDAGLKVSATVFIATQGLDWHSTKAARDSGNGVEGNPLMDVNAGAQLAIKAATTAGIVFVASRVHRKHPKLAKGLLWGASAFTFTVAAHNYRIAGRR